MRVTVELFGIPRARAGVAQTVAEGSNLVDVILDLARRFPALGKACTNGRSLKPGYTANLRLLNPSPARPEANRPTVASFNGTTASTIAAFPAFGG